MPTDMNDTIVPAMSIFDMAMKALEQRPGLYERWKREAHEKTEVVLSFTGIIGGEDLKTVLAAWRLTHPVTVSVNVIDQVAPVPQGSGRSSPQWSPEVLAALKARAGMAQDGKLREAQKVADAEEKTLRQRLFDVAMNKVRLFKPV